jgi:hypothetical protein
VTKHNLGPMPEPMIEPAEPHPGGVDAVTGPAEEPVVPDLPAELTPMGQAAPLGILPELGLGEDTSTQATRGDPEPMSGERESPA